MQWSGLHWSVVFLIGLERLGLEWAGVANLAQFRQPGQIWTALEDSVMEVWSASGLERNGLDLSTEVRFEQSRTNQDRIGTNSPSCGWYCVESYLMTIQLRQAIVFMLQAARASK